MKKQLFLSIAYILCFTFVIKAQNFTFVHITDLHVADSYCAGDYDFNGEMFLQLRDKINNLDPKPAFVISSGDISHVGNSGNDGMYAAFTQYLYPDSVVNPDIGDFFMDSLQTIPIYFTPGNHDFRTGNVPPLSNEDLTVYKNIICSITDYSIVYQNAVIICMNSGYDVLRPLWDDSNVMSPEGSGFTDEQCNWLRNILDSNITKKKIIAMHHPPVNKTGFLCDGTPFTGTIIDDADGSIKYNRITLLDICDSNNVDIVLAGHVHQNVVVNRYGTIVDENYPDSTRYIQTGAGFHGCYRIITVDSSFVTVSTPQSITSSNEGIHNIPKNADLFRIYPNPFTTSTTINFHPYLKIDNLKFKIYNLFGQEIKVIYNINDREIKINRNNIPNGIYFIHVFNNNILIGSSKIIVN